MQSSRASRSSFERVVNNLLMATNELVPLVLRKLSATPSLLTRIDVTRCGAISAENMQALAIALASNASVVYLWLGDIRIQQDGARLLATSLTTNSSLAFLRLENNSIGNDGACALASSLETNTSVASLVLEGNSIGFEGTLALATMLATNRTIWHLDLSCNVIGDDGACTLASAFAHGSSVTHLNLWLCGIRVRGARAIANALADIEYINLGDNCLQDDGVCALASALHRNTSLYTLGLSFTHMNHRGVHALAEALAIDNTTVMEIRMSGIGLSFSYTNGDMSVITQSTWRNRITRLVRILLLLSRADSPLWQLPDWLYERIVRRVAMYNITGSNSIHHNITDMLSGIVKRHVAQHQQARAAR